MLQNSNGAGDTIDITPYNLNQDHVKWGQGQYLIESQPLQKKTSWQFTAGKILPRDPGMPPFVYLGKAAIS